MTSLRQELDARFSATVKDAPRPEGWPPFALPGAIGATLEAYDCPPAACAYYTEKMPALLVEQLRPEDRARQLLFHRIGRAPRLREALDGLYRVLGDEAIDARAFTGAASPGELLSARPTVAALYAHTLFGSGLPLLGAWPLERQAYAPELDGDWDGVLDLRLSGHLIHEMCHGPPQAHAEHPVPWLIAEAAALTLGARARRAHIFPDEPGEAVPGVSLFVCVGSALARRWSRGGLFRLLAGAPLWEVAGEARARSLEAAAWQDWLARREPPFARDALSALAWIKLNERPLPGDDLLQRAAATPFFELPWWQEEQFFDEDVAEAVAALFQINVIAPRFRTQPCPRARLVVDVESCVISTEKRPEGVFAEPPFWLLPPPLCRRLWERGARRVVMEGGDQRQITQALCEPGQGRLDEETRWTFSR